MSDLPYYVSPDRLRRLQTVSIERWGGQVQEMIEGCLEGATKGAVSAMHYEDAEVADGAVVYAAYLLRNVVMKHCMVDGNKRLGWLAMCEALELAGWAVNADDAEAYRFIKDDVIIARSSVEVIANWIDDHLIAIEDAPSA